MCIVLSKKKQNIVTVVTKETWSTLIKPGAQMGRQYEPLLSEYKDSTLNVQPMYIN